jgi:mannose-1-phosphate guanylyltransferase
MQALILVGGEGTRLRPLTCNTPKAMVPVLNTPYLEHVIRYLAGHGVNDIILAQGHLPKAMDEHFRDGGRFGVKLTYALESQPMGTAGAVKNAEKYLTDRFLVLNGDIITDLDITAMCRFHESHQAKATIALTPVEDPTAYGLIETTSEGRVSRFLEKPSRDQITTNMINAGTYVLNKEVLERITAGTNYSFERQLFPQLLESGKPIFAYSSQAYWIDIGTPEKYHLVHRDLLGGRVRGYNHAQGKVVQVGHGCQIHPEAQIEGPAIIGDNCIIRRGAKLTGPVVIGPGSTIAEEVTINSSILWQNVRCEMQASVNECLIANDSQLGTEANIEKSVIGDHVTISRNSRLGPGSRIWPLEK